MRPNQPVRIRRGRQGYTFSHRPGSYFYEKLQKLDRRDNMTRFVAWGRGTLAALRARTLESSQAPTYLVKYLRAHLERSGGGVEALRDLVSFEWLRAWSLFDKGSFAGFLADVRRVWQLAEQADRDSARVGKGAPFLDIEVRCALCISSVISMAQEIPEALLALVRRRCGRRNEACHASNFPMCPWSARCSRWQRASPAFVIRCRGCTRCGAVGPERDTRTLCSARRQCLREPLAARDTSTTRNGGCQHCWRHSRAPPPGITSTY